MIANKQPLVRTHKPAYNEYREDAQRREAKRNDKGRNRQAQHAAKRGEKEYAYA